MNIHDDERQVLDLLSELNTLAPGDPEVERHLAEFRATKASLEANPELVEKLDAAIAELEVGDEPVTVSPGHDVQFETATVSAGVNLGQPVGESLVEFREAQEGLFEKWQDEVLSKVADQIRASATQPRRRLTWRRQARPKWGMLTFAGALSILMLCATVLLALFGSGVIVTAIIPTFVAAPAFVAAAFAATHLVIIWRALSSPDRDRRAMALELLKVVDRNNVELESIRARSKVALTAIERVRKTDHMLDVDFNEGRIKLEGS